MDAFKLPNFPTFYSGSYENNFMLIELNYESRFFSLMGGSKDRAAAAVAAALLQAKAYIALGPLSGGVYAVTGYLCPAPGFVPLDDGRCVVDADGAGGGGGV